MNIFLINPPAYHRVEEYDLPTWQHLGIGRLSSYVRQFGHKVTLIDAKLQRLEIPVVLKIIEEKKPDLVGLTAMTLDIHNAYTIAREIKDINRRIVTVIGGCHATAMLEVTLKEESCLDYVVFGEGERTLKELLDVIADGASVKLLSQVNGIVFRAGAEIIKTEVRPWNTYLEELPIPDWQLHPYATHYKLETSRGCPFKCNYCMRVLGETVRYFPIANVLNEFKHVMQLKENVSMEIVEETLTLNRGRIHELLDGMIESGVGKKIKWSCSTRADLVDRELLEKMREAGCCEIGIGAESGNSKVLERTKKNIKLEDVIYAIKLTHKVGLKSYLSFILGHPDEKLEEMVDTINLAVRANPSIPAIGTMVPYPGTEIAEIVEKGGGNYRLLSKDWTEYNRYFSYVLELKDVSKPDMDKIQLIGILKVFVYNWRILDLVKFIYQFRREILLFFKTTFSRRAKKGKDVSPSRISFLQFVRIFFSRC